MTKESHLSPPLKIEDLDQLRSIGDKVFISGVIYTARDTVIMVFLPVLFVLTLLTGNTQTGFSLVAQCTPSKAR
jgi:hypothetical protein